MGFLSKIALRNSPFESPAVPLMSLANPASWFINWSNGGPTSSSEHVTAFSSLQVTTISACVKLLSEGIGQMPVSVIERIEPRGQRIAYKHPYFDMLSAEWSPEITATVGMQVSLVHALLWGTSYIELVRDAGNRIVELWPRKPWLTEPKRDRTGTLVYETRDTNDHSTRIIDAADMMCVTGLSLDGYVGQQTIHLARETVGLAMALERHSALFFGNGAVSSATLEVPTELSDKAYQRLKTSMDMQSTGSNKFRTMILEGGSKWNSISSQNDQAQFLESKKLVRSEICSLFRVPLYMIASDESRGVKSNTEMISQDFLTWTMAPWLVRYTQQMNAKLFPKMGRTSGKYSVRFETKALMAADSASRMAYYAQGRVAGLFTINECRLDEGLEPVGPEGDLLMVPLNMIPATELLKEQSDTAPPPVVEQPAGSTEPNESEEKSSPLLPRLIRAYSSLFTDSFNRLASRSKRDSTSISHCLLPALEATSASIRDMLATQERVAVEATESNRAIEKYLTGLASRADTIDQPAEITRALKMLTHAAYRDMALAKATEALTEVPSNETESE